MFYFNIVNNIMSCICKSCQLVVSNENLLIVRACLLIHRKSADSVDF